MSCQWSESYINVYVIDLKMTLLVTSTFIVLIYKVIKEVSLLFLHRSRI